jgi:DNA topoisomerase-3
MQLHTPPCKTNDSSQYNPIWEFCYPVNGQQADMVFTSVAGHLMELDFAPAFQKWHS